MDSKRYHDTLLRLSRWQAVWAIGCLGLLLVVGLQGVVIYQQRHLSRTVMVPLHLHEPFWVDDDQVSSTYLAEMARYVVGLYVNVTPKTAAYAHKQLLKLVPGERYAALAAQYREHERALRQDEVSYVFFPSTVTPNPATRDATVYGQLNTYVGTSRVSVTRMAYHVSFRLDNGRLWFTGLTHEQESEDA